MTGAFLQLLPAMALPPRLEPYKVTMVKPETLLPATFSHTLLGKPAVLNTRHTTHQPPRTSQPHADRSEHPLENCVE